ncbi:MAG: polysaccharide deacetylase family protein [Treponema sp.]|jgi:peptidoglycan/xylan/chitin deacetylase (PgdA/CDA1 family)|nr:polysaccharide deacetylase family protein [Treponema sp.]
MKYIALTFDDGPCDVSENGGTAAMLSVLEKLNVKVTFFVIGQNVRDNNKATKAIFEAGHELANHSDGYAPLGNAQKNEISASLESANAAIKEITGKSPSLFRAPNLQYGSELFNVCKEKGMSLIGGSAHNDWAVDAESILKSVLNDPKDGDIIVLHENNTSKGNTMAVLPQIVGGLRERGFEILTVSRLAKLKGIVLEPGISYNSFNN